MLHGICMQAGRKVQLTRTKKQEHFLSESKGREIGRSNPFRKARRFPTMPRFKASGRGLCIRCEFHATPQHPDGHRLDSSVAAPVSLLFGLVENWAHVWGCSDGSIATNDSLSWMATWREHVYELIYMWTPDSGPCPTRTRLWLC